MGFVIGLAFFVLIMWLIVRAATTNLLTSGVAIARLAKNGVRARGLVLASSQLTAAVTVGGRRFERRTMTIDVEMPGQDSYVTSGQFLVPRGLVEAIPGSSLDLAVDRSDRKRVVVLGPGGFSGPWLQTGPPNAY